MFSNTNFVCLLAFLFVLMGFCEYLCLRPCVCVCVFNLQRNDLLDVDVDEAEVWVLLVLGLQHNLLHQPEID